MRRWGFFKCLEADFGGKEGKMIDTKISVSMAMSKM
jgi:hypothetical protein